MIPQGSTKTIPGQDDTTLKKLIKIHLLVSVHPNNEVPKSNEKDDRDYEVLLLNPKYHEFFALIRQIAVIHPCEKTSDEKDPWEKKESKNSTGSSTTSLI